MKNEQAEPPPEFAAIFSALKKILQAHEPQLVVYANEPGNYHLNTRHFQKNKQPLSFGAVQIKKNYVSFHLVPIYLCPELLTHLSLPLRARMQGKSCFNFKKQDPALFEELARLTEAGFAKFQGNSWVA